MPNLTRKCLNCCMTHESSVRNANVKWWCGSPARDPMSAANSGAVRNIRNAIPDCPSPEISPTLAESGERKSLDVSPSYTPKYESHASQPPSRFWRYDGPAVGYHLSFAHV